LIIPEDFILRYTYNWLAVFQVNALSSDRGSCRRQITSLFLSERDERDEEVLRYSLV
jgi:hypothetical protein